MLHLWHVHHETVNVRPRIEIHLHEQTIFLQFRAVIRPSDIIVCYHHEKKRKFQRKCNGGIDICSL